MTIHEYKKGIRHDSMPKIQKDRCPRIFPAPYFSICARPDQSLGMLNIYCCWFKQKFWRNENIKATLMQKAFMKFVKVNILKKAARIGSARSHKPLANV